MERRISIIPFDRQFTAAERDVNLEKKLSLSSCKQAILTWLVEGAWLYLNEGLNEPTVVAQLRQEYIEDNRTYNCDNSVERFITECLDLNTDKYTPASELLYAYASFCHSQKLIQKTNDAFYKEVSDRLRQYKRRTKNGPEYKIGIISNSN